MFDCVWRRRKHPFFHYLLALLVLEQYRLGFIGVLYNRTKSAIYIALVYDLVFFLELFRMLKVLLELILELVLIVVIHTYDLCVLE